MSLPLTDSIFRGLKYNKVSKTSLEIIMKKNVLIGTSSVLSGNAAYIHIVEQVGPIRHGRW